MSRKIDSHEAYLNIVFAWANRLRTVDLVAVATRYEVDPAALTAAPCDPCDPRPVERLLRIADEQRSELRQHLDALVSEYVSGGMEYGVALVKAQQTLGEPRALGRQIARATSEAVLDFDARWLTFLRFHDGLPIGICVAMLFAATVWPLPRLALLAANVGLMASFAFMSGYAAGWVISPDLRCLVSGLIPILEAVEGDGVLSVRKTVVSLKRTHRLVLAAERSRRFWWLTDCFLVLAWSISLIDAIHGSSFKFVTGGLVMAFTVASFAQSIGIRLGRRRRLALSARRAS